MKFRTWMTALSLLASLSITLPLFAQQPVSTIQISANVYEFYYRLETGTGKYDHIGIHRVTQVTNGQPVPSDNAVLLVHGDAWGFDQAFMHGISRRSIGAYLASQGIDVWGIDLAWTLVPSTQKGFKFMENWGMQHDIDDIERALSFARLVRTQTGGDGGRLALLGWSRGGWLGFALLNQESQQSCGNRQVKGYVPVDLLYKTNSPSSQAFLCSLEAYYDQQIASGVYNSNGGQQLQDVAEQAIQHAYRTSIYAGSPYTNLTWSLTVGAAPYQFESGSYFTPYFHYVGGNFPNDDFQAIPNGLSYSNVGEWNDFEFGPSFYEPVQLLAEASAITCGDDPNLPFDKHLKDINVPVFYVGAGGGFGSYGLYQLSLLGSTDVSNHIVSFYPPDQQAFDFGHVDLFYAEDAQNLLWNDILQWLKKHQHDDSCSTK
jgi:pimeloyl-ACP methyl ester carboxylesterase